MREQGFRVSRVVQYPPVVRVECLGCGEAARFTYTGALTSKVVRWEDAHRREHLGGPQ